ncbi:transposase (plasmid) [Thalassoporum mexicanum PCC 7367]|uniref:helix-turn-helix domain-containing protein n=1 Tax=Thalassoporum mexicanum TaxID=3457544 RepID=UPI00029FAFBA|nr:transposase [Pseudanabaena sp. PCC 7367]AFY71898.1 transposase [Pseudanabaena sp. PCC 7367]
MRAHSLDLRYRIVVAYENGEGSIRELAQRFSVSKNSVHKLLQLYRDKGTIRPTPYRAGVKPKFSPPHLVMLAELVADHPEATLVDLCQQMHQRTGIEVSVSTMCRILQKQKLDRKKHCVS